MYYNATLVKQQLQLYIRKKTHNNNSMFLSQLTVVGFILDFDAFKTLRMKEVQLQPV